MLCYSFRILKEQGYKNVTTETFANAEELYATLLTKGVTNQIKRGLGREYQSSQESLSSPRGRIMLTDSIRLLSTRKMQLTCDYDIFSVNSYVNRIIKSTMEFLLRSKISMKRKKELRKLFVYFRDIDSIDLNHVDWNVHYNRTNQTYCMLISICQLVVKGLLQTNSDGTIRLMDFINDQKMHQLYERFLFEYFRQEFKELKLKVTRHKITWNLDDDAKELLPIMQPDIVLSYNKKILIIDAKFYSKTTQTYRDTVKLRSAHLYQIFTYVKNMDTFMKKVAIKNNFPFYEVSGLLLYALSETRLDQHYSMSGNQISAETLNLDSDWSAITSHLNKIVKDNFGLEWHSH